MRARAVKKLDPERSLGENSARTLRFTADTFNTFNHVNLDNPNVSTNSSSIGTIGSSQPAARATLFWRDFGGSRTTAFFRSQG